MNSDLNEAIARATPGGPAVEVKNEEGKVIGYCGRHLPGVNPAEASIHGLLKVAEALDGNI